MRSVPVSSGSSRRRQLARERRGATLVMVAISLVVLVGFAGVGVDFAKAYAARTRLKTVADAAAMAGAIEMLNAPLATRDAAVRAAATTYMNFNYVEKSKLADSMLVQPVIWDFTNRRADSTTATTFSDPKVNAVRITAFYKDSTMFAGVFNRTQLSLRERTVAALGSITTQKCMKPWAVPLSNIKATLQQDPTNTDPLTTSDVATLADNKTPIQFKTSANNGAQSPAGQGTIGGTLIPGNYYAVDFPPLMDVNNQSYSAVYGSPSTGANTYGNAIQDACDDAAPVHIGDWLATETGNMNGQTQSGVQALCNIPKNPKNDPATCSPQQLVTLPIYSQSGPKNGGKTAVQVAYLGEFYVTGLYQDGTVVGYLTALKPTGNGGAFSSGVGPTMKGALVQ